MAPQEPAESQGATEDESQADNGALRSRRRSQILLIGFILVLGVTNIAYRVVTDVGLGSTNALYIGVPMILAIGLALLPPAKNGSSMVLRGSNFAVVLAAIILPEGIICLIFAWPLVVFVAWFVNGIVELFQKRKKPKGQAMVVAALPLLLLSLEGVVGVPVSPYDSATATVIVDATSSEVQRALTQTPRFDSEMPTFLKLGFNKPVSAQGSGLQVGDERIIRFTGGSHDDHPMRMFGITGERSVDHESEMYLSVTASEPGRVVFSINHDMTMLSRWADLNAAIVTWEPIDGSRTRVKWRLEYERLISPSFYFAPMQQYGMDKSAEFLLQSVIVDGLDQ